MAPTGWYWGMSMRIKFNQDAALVDLQKLNPTKDT